MVVFSSGAALEAEWTQLKFAEHRVKDNAAWMTVCCAMAAETASGETDSAM